MNQCANQTCLKANERLFRSLLPTEMDIGTLLQGTVIAPNTTEDLEGWEFVESVDFINLRKKDDHCWLQFRGIKPNAPSYILNFSHGTYRKVCGIKNVYEPIILDFETHAFGLEGWKSVASQLSACKRVTVSGLSWGGAMAELLTACANRGRLHDLYSSEVPTFNVSSLYTFGAFVGTKEPLRNVSDPDGCFTGTQFFFPNDPVSRLVPDMLGHHKPRSDVLRFGFHNQRLELNVRTCKHRKTDTVNILHDNKNVSDLSKIPLLHKHTTPGLKESFDILTQYTGACMAKPACEEE